MNEIIKQINDRLIVPMELLKILNLNKGDLVKFNIDDNNPNLITIKRYTEQELVKESNVEIGPIDESKQKLFKEYNVMVRTRKIITIPNDIFKKYNLSYQSYKTTCTKVDNKLIITLIKDDNGSFKYRKDNEISLSYLEDKYNIDVPIGIQIKLRTFDESQQISLVFDINSTTLKPIKVETSEKQNNYINSNHDQKTISELSKDLKDLEKPSKTVEKIKQNQEKQKVVKLNSFNDERTITINKRHVITIPNDIFKKLNLNNETYLPVCTEDSKNIYISLVTADTYNESDSEYLKHYRNTNALTITEAIKDFIETPEIGSTFTLMYNEYSENHKSILFIFDKSKVKKLDNININKAELIVKEEKEIQDDLKTPSIIKQEESQTLYDEQNEKDPKRKQLYHEINKRIKRGDSIKFINKEDLPKNETNCFICKKELTDTDISMYNHHRICNNCKRSKLKSFLSPIMELAKYNKNKKENNND